MSKRYRVLSRVLNEKTHVWEEESNSKSEAKVDSVLSAEFSLNQAEPDHALLGKRSDDGFLVVYLYLDALLFDIEEMQQNFVTKNNAGQTTGHERSGWLQGKVDGTNATKGTKKRMSLTQRAHMDTNFDCFGLSESQPLTTPIKKPKVFSKRCCKKVMSPAVMVRIMRTLALLYTS